MTPVQVLTLGECMALIYPPAGQGLEEAQVLQQDMAGAEANLCIAISRLGNKAGFITRAGMDPFGRRIYARLAAEGVDLSGWVDDPTAPTGLFFREHLADGQRRVYYYRAGSAASRLSPEDLPAQLFEGIKVLHLTGITPALSPACAAACRKAVELAHQAGAKVSFDPNFRSKLWDADTANKELRWFYEHADLVLMGHEDARATLADGSAEEVLRAAIALGAQTAVLKLADEGAMALQDERFYRVPAAPVREVVDPVGAGDGFDAGFLAGWLRDWDMMFCLRLGALVGAQAVQVAGDYHGYPRWDDLQWQD